MKQRKAKILQYTKKARRAQKTAKTVLWLAAGVTIVILVWIIGYVVYNGFVSDLHREYPVIAKGGPEVILDWQAEQTLVFIVNNSVRIEELSAQDIIDFYCGEVRDWVIAKQDLKVKTFALDMTASLGKAFSEKVLGKHLSYNSNNRFVENDEEMIKKVAATIGAIGFINPEKMERARNNPKVKIINVRAIALVAHPAVFEIRNQKKLRYLKEEDMRAIFSGNAHNWQEVNGIDLHIVPVLFNEDLAIAKQFKQFALGDDKRFSLNAVHVDNQTDLMSVINRNEGAVGFTSYFYLKNHFPDQIVKVERREVTPNLTLSYLIEEPKKFGKVGGVSTIILNTVFMILLTVIMATPLGVGAAIFFTEYAGEGRLVRSLRFFTETLAGIPSIIFGLFGMLVFVDFLGLKFGLLSGTLTITLMVLPTIIRTAEESLKSVPRAYREESFALGATRWQTVCGVIIPTAVPGILTGVILAIGRAVGETAAVILTLGNSPTLARNLFSSARVLSVHLYLLATEGISFERAFATGTILIVIILIVNTVATQLIKKMNKMHKA
ncbi:MAG: phosphate ABC transporter permease PstA [Spirochaetales bacterium]|nr:phosphate ABC transporter permease PstA [Spirochaetales bacterium]